MNVIRNICPEIAFLELLPHFREAHMLIKCCSGGVNQFKSTIFGWLCVQTCSIQSSWGCVIHSYRHDECGIWLIRTHGDNIISTPSLVSSSETQKKSLSYLCAISHLWCPVPANTLRNNDVAITSKRRHFDVITSKWRRFVVITTCYYYVMCSGGCRVMGVDTTPMPSYTDVTRTSRRLKSPASWMFVQQLHHHHHDCKCASVTRTNMNDHISKFLLYRLNWNISRNVLTFLFSDNNDINDLSCYLKVP